MAISSRVKLYCYNILEEGTVTALATAGYPASRLYDRSLGFYWMYPDLSVQVLQSTVLSVDTLIVEGHNFSGITLSWQYSTDGNSWSDAVPSWVQPNNLQILKSLTTPISYAYWRLTGTVSAQAVEIFMGRSLSIPVVWSDPPRLGHTSEVLHERTYGGVDHFLRVGPKRRVRSYTVFMDRLDFPVSTYLSDIEYLDDFTKPLFIMDHEGECFLSWFDSLPNRSAMNENLMEVQFSFTEVAG